MARNPWIDQHLAGEMDYTGGGYTRRRARRLVMSEYAGAPEPLPCECGDQLHYRATVGAMMCPTCRAMAHADGTPIA